MLNYYFIFEHYSKSNDWFLYEMKYRTEMGKNSFQFRFTRQLGVSNPFHVYLIKLVKGFICERLVGTKTFYFCH